MKIILSRKGFDSSNGGLPSPIMPDGALLSMPIPSNDYDRYDALVYKGMTYSEILRQLAPKKNYSHCHLDPDLRENCRKERFQQWTPAFGQIGSAQGVLSNAKVEIGDLFLFFGWFRRTEMHNGQYRFVRRNKGSFYDYADLHVIYGYMQIGEIINDKNRIAEYTWHPHSSDSRIENNTNTLYLPMEELTILPGFKGYGTLDYRKDRVLTMEGKNRATWNAYPFLQPENIYESRKNAAKGEGLYYNGIWQELVVYESEGLFEWVKSIIQ